MPNLRDGRWRYLYAFMLTAFTLLAITPTAALAGPIVQILQPEQGEVVSGVIWIDVSYESTSDDPINRVEIYIDGEVARKWNLASPKKKGTSSFSWDFSLAAATNHTISAKAFDTSGASGSATITVTVKRAEASDSDKSGGKKADQIPPVINIYYPSQGAKLSGLTEIRAEARDNVGVQQVYFYIDGRLHKMIYNSPPFYDQWDTSQASDGKHVLEAVAVDASSNEARSAQVTVFVENHAMTRMSGTEGSGESGLQAQSADSTQAASTEDSAEMSGPGPRIHATSPSTVTPATQPDSARGRAADIEAPPTPQKPPKASSTDGTVADASAPGPDTDSSPAPSRTATLPAVDTGKMVTQRLSRPSEITDMPEKADSGRKGGLAVARPGSQAEADTTTPAKATPVAGGDGHQAARMADTDLEEKTPRVAHTAATPEMSETRLASQRISRPQMINPMPAVASAAAASDAMVPTYHAMNRVEPTAEFGAVAMPQRISSPGDVETGPRVASSGSVEKTTGAMAARTDSSTVFNAADHETMPQRTTTPTPAKALTEDSGAMLTMLPKTGDDTRTNRSEIAELGKAIAEAPVEDIAVMFDGDMLTLRTAPETIGDVPTGPLREMFEHTDGILYWFPVTKEVRAISPTTDLHLTIGHDDIAVNGQDKEVTVAPYIKRGRTMVPLQFIANTLDVTITFDPGSKRLVVETNEF